MVRFESFIKYSLPISTSREISNKRRKLPAKYTLAGCIGNILLIEFLNGGIIWRRRESFRQMRKEGRLNGEGGDWREKINVYG